MSIQQHTVQFKQCERAIEQGQVQEIRQLVQQGLSVNAVDDTGWSLLMIAAFRSQIRIIEALIDLGAELELRNRSGETALIVAARQHCWHSVEALLTAGADVNARCNSNSTPLIVASATRSYANDARANRLETVKTLLRYKADPKIQDSEGCDAVFWARATEDVKLITTFSKGSYSIS